MHCFIRYLYCNKNISETLTKNIWIHFRTNETRQGRIEGDKRRVATNERRASKIQRYIVFVKSLLLSTTEASIDLPTHRHTGRPTHRPTDPPSHRPTDPPSPSQRVRACVRACVYLYLPALEFVVIKSAVVHIYPGCYHLELIS